MNYGDIVTARCCRDWPVVFGWPIRSCGICGERPTVDLREEGTDAGDRG